MSNQDEYKSIPALVAALKEQTDLLENGLLPGDQLSGMLDNTRELYDRLVVLRYKAIESGVKGVAPEEKEEPEPKKNTFKIGKARDKSVKKKEKEKAANIGLQLDFNAQAKMTAKEEIIPRNQVNLIDAIQQEESHPEEDGVSAEPLVEAVVESTAPVEAAPVEAPPVEEIDPIEEAPLTQETSPLVEEPASETLNEKLVSAEEGTLADRLKKQPIPDLKGAIGIAQKFLFMNDLFEGEHANYHEAVDQLNSMSSSADAMAYLNQLVGQYSWDVDSDSAKSFTELVERRYM